MEVDLAAGEMGVAAVADPRMQTRRHQSSDSLMKVLREL
jgi:hypothetical protein